MRLLADENIPTPLVAALRQRHHDVLAVRDVMPGADDRAVLARAQVEQRVLITLDKDLGELAYRFGLPSDSGVILFRLTGSSPQLDNARALAALESRDDWTGRFAVVTERFVRIRALPSITTDRTGDSSTP